MCISHADFSCFRGVFSFLLSRAREGTFAPGHHLAWQVVGAHAGVKVLRLHDARHTHESLWLRLGIHPDTVQERLGHSSIRMTLDIDSHVAPGLQEAAALRFDEPLTANHENGVVEKGG